MVFSVALFENALQELSDKWSFVSLSKNMWELLMKNEKHEKNHVTYDVIMLHISAISYTLRHNLVFWLSSFDPKFLFPWLVFSIIQL